VWAAEGGDSAKAPDFARLFQQSGNNVRAALNNLELELIEPGIGVAQTLGAERPERKPVPIDEVRCRRSDAARRAWITIRANREKKNVRTRRKAA